MPSTSRDQRTQQKREGVLNAAQALFLEQGFEGTSMDAIAAAASVSKPTLYRYYSDKEGLFIAVLERLAFQPLSAEVLVALQDTPVDSPEAVESVLNTWAQTVLAHVIQPPYLGLIRLLIAELPRFPTLGSLFAAAAQQGGTPLLAVLKDARQQGVIVVDDLQPALRLLVSALVYYVLSGLFTPEEPRPPSPEEVAAQIHLVVQAITAPTS